MRVNYKVNGQHLKLYSHNLFSKEIEEAIRLYLTRMMQEEVTDVELRTNDIINLLTKGVNGEELSAEGKE